MDDPVSTNELIAVVLLGSLAAASAGTLFWLFQRHIGGRPLMAYQPRRRVPWGFWAPALMLVPALLPIAAQSTPEAASKLEVPHTIEAVDEGARKFSAGALWLQATVFVGLAVMCYAALASIHGATMHDLGLPTDWRGLAGDVRAGAVGYLAVLLPVYGLNVVLALLLAPEHGHPLIEDLSEHVTVGMMAAAAAAAVVAAPVFEETAFRLVFQGWLEKHDRAPEAASAAAMAIGQPDEGLQQERAESLGVETVALPRAPEAANGEVAATAQPAIDGSDAADPGPTLVLVHHAPDRPCNWGAIVVSSSLFALAHLGQGVAPFSLFPLGMALGYLYQRTHRIVPAMVCHALFNSTSLVAVWLASWG